MAKTKPVVTKNRKHAVVQDGVVFEVRGSELVARIRQRIAWHQRGNAQHGLALRDLLAAPDKAPEGYSRSMRDELQKRVREHEERAAFLTFVAGHLQPQTVYRLRSSDLRMMEIMPNHVHWF